MKKEKSLIRKGILDLKPYIPGKPIEEVKRELGLKEVIKLASPAYETAVKIVFLCNPNNPTGTIVDKEAVDRFIKQVPEDVIVVFDEAYYDYVEDKNYPNSLSYVLEEKNIIVLRTFSKIAGIAGVRIGYGIAKKELIGHLMRVVNPFTTNRLAQVAALASLDDEEHRKKVLRSNQEGKKYLCRELKQLGLFYTASEANFLFIDLKEDSEVIFEKLLKKGVIIRPGKTWGCPNFIRVTIGTAYENKKFIQAIREVMGL